MPIAEATKDSDLHQERAWCRDCVETHLKAYLPASFRTQSSCPAVSLCPHTSNTFSTGSVNTSSSDLMTCAPAISFTLRHSLMSALIVHSVLTRTVAVFEEVALDERCDRQVRRFCSRMLGSDVQGFGSSIRATETRRDSCGRAICQGLVSKVPHHLRLTYGKVWFFEKSQQRLSYMILLVLGYQPILKHQRPFPSQP